MPWTDLRRVLVRLQAEAEGALVSATEEEREETEERFQIRAEALLLAKPTAARRRWR